jgi:hypothetical protein
LVSTADCQWEVIGQFDVHGIFMTGMKIMVPRSFNEALSAQGELSATWGR